MALLLLRLRRAWALAGHWMGLRLRRNFYLYLALLLSLFAVFDALSGNHIAGMKQKAFDLMVRERFLVPKADQDIIIVDIDEKSLAQMATDNGRWPWPRQVLGEFVEKLNAQQQPRAIVFDILLSDPDVFNPDSDAYFNEVIAGTHNTWFPYLRLDSSYDGKSDLRIGLVPNIRPLPPVSDTLTATGTLTGTGPSAPDADATIAMVLPHFSAVLNSKRLGTHNIDADKDGIVREYPLWHSEHGFELPSLPLSLARSTDAQIQAPQQMLLNWRGPPFSYHSVSFSDIYRELQKEKPALAADLFRNKIVIIGSTAPSLFDLKATALSRQHPGVEILATAIDNLLHRDWLRVPEARTLYLLMTLLIIWGTAWSFYRFGANWRLDKLYGFSQFILLAFAYLAINLGNTYINLTGPVMLGFAYYSMARFYAFATARALDQSIVARSRNSAGQQALMLLLHFTVPTREENALRRLGEALASHCTHKPSVEVLCGRQSGLWRLNENMVILCWSVDNHDHSTWAAMQAEVQALPAQLPTQLQALSLSETLPPSTLRYAAITDQTVQQECDWQRLLGLALIQLNQNNSIQQDSIKENSIKEVC